MTYDPNSSSHIYPVPLQKLIGYSESADFKSSKEVVLVFIDAEGKQVCFRVPYSAVDGIIKKLSEPPATIEK